MNSQITYRPRGLAALIAVAITGLTLTSFDSLARPGDARNNPAATNVAQAAAQVPFKLEPIVVTAKRLPAMRNLPTLR